MDDYFAPEARSTRAHALQCVTRLFKALLGDDAIALEKMEHGKRLRVLGLDMIPTRRDIKCKLNKVKAQKWAAEIRDVLRMGKLTPGAASKMAGRLSWAGSHTFRRLGRAMLRPLYDQKFKYSGTLSKELRRSLEWWLDVLVLEIAEAHPWEHINEHPAHLFCDAAGTPPHLGAVLSDGSDCLWTHMEVPAEVLRQFQQRRDSQIMGLELLAISLGMSSFEDRLKRRAVVIHCDNSGSEVALSKGRARSLDHSQLVHSQWLHAAREHMKLYVLRVASEDNVADLPSRSEFSVLKEHEAVEVSPKLHTQYRQSEAWEVLKERWCSGAKGDQARQSDAQPV